MSEFKVACPHCDQHIAYDESYWGVQIQCPGCTAPIQISAAAASGLSGPVRAAPVPAPVAGGLRISRSEAAPSVPRLRRQAEPSRPPVFAPAGHGEYQSESGWPTPEPLTTGDTGADGDSEGFGMYEQFQETAWQVQVLPEFKQVRPNRLTGFKAFWD